MPVPVSLKNIESHLEIDGLHQMLLHLKYPPSHTPRKSAITSSNSFNPVKVCTGTQHARDHYLIHRLQNTRPTHTSRHSWPGYGRSSVSRTHLRILRFLTIIFTPANHRFFTHFGEDHCRMSSIHSVVEAPARRRNLILTTISKLLFNLPVEHRERLEKLWVDSLVYSSAWRKHVSGRVEDLKQTMTWVSEPLLSAVVSKLIYL